MPIWVWAPEVRGEERVWGLEQVDVAPGSVASTLYFRVAPEFTYYHSPRDYVQHRFDMGYAVEVDDATVKRWQQRLKRATAPTSVPGRWADELEPAPLDDQPRLREDARTADRAPGAATPAGGA